MSTPDITPAVWADPAHCGELTEEKWEAWLDAYPGRRAGFGGRLGADERQAARARVARLYALRASPVAARLAGVVAAAAAFRDALKAALAAVSPAAVADALAAFGLPCPGRYDVWQGCGPESFDEFRDAARAALKRLAAFDRDAGGMAAILLPEPEPESAPAAPAPADAVGGRAA